MNQAMQDIALYCLDHASGWSLPGWVRDYYASIAVCALDCALGLDDTPALLREQAI